MLDMEMTSEWIAQLTQLDKDYLRAYLSDNTVNTNDIPPELDEPLRQKECPHCKSQRIIRHGRTAKNRQRYMCKDCHKTFTPVTHNFFRSSRLTYKQWLTFFECEMTGCSLRETAYQTGLSVTSCFYLRHKLYTALQEAQADKLSGDVQLDTTFLDMDLKGLKDMPKPVRGSKRNPPVKVLFDKDPHICITTAVDENKNILYVISGYGGESTDKYEKHIDRYDPDCTIISDEHVTIARFAKRNHLKTAPLTEKRHKRKDGRHISDVNSLHSDLKNLIRNKRGISIRHLQGYLNWLVFTRKAVKEKRGVWPYEAYGFAHIRDKILNNSDICSMPFPISLEDIYGRYHYGMFRTTQ